MEDYKIKLDYASFPNNLASFGEKKSELYGLKVGQAIQYEWFAKGSGSSRFYTQWNNFHKLRLYARGEQPVEKYKNELAINGDLSYLNLDWTPVPIVPKFVDIIVNGMNDRMFKVKAYAQDAMSQAKRNKFQENVEGQMISRETLSLLKEKTGVNTFSMPEEELPNNDEELSLYMQLNYKPAIEIAEENAINTVMDENKFDEKRRLIDYDATVLGVCVGKHEFLPGEGVRTSYVDPANWIYSYTEDPYFKDCFYFGEVKTVHIGELYKINPNLTNEQMEEIKQAGGAWYNYFRSERLAFHDPFIKDSVTLMYFNYKTFKDVVYKKKILETGGFKMIEKDDTFNPTDDEIGKGRYEKVSKKVDTWFDGVMVMGTNIIIKWQESENMIRPKSSAQHALPNYIAVAPRMYKGRIESITQRMIPYADAIQLTHLKIQQVMAKVVPDGVFIDADGINEVDLGTGGSYNPEDALNLYFQTGSVIGRSFTQEGDFNNARMPIQELSKNSGVGKLQALIIAYNHNLDMLRTVTGLNEARDASNPDPNSLVGLQKLAALNSNTATRHILTASLDMHRRFAEAISYRVADILEYSDFKEDFINRIGRYNVSILDEIKDLYIYDFGIFIEMSPDEEEKAQLEANIQMALSKENIYLEDAIDIREIRNIKVANQMLKLRRKQKQDREERLQMQQQAMQAQIQQQSQAMAAQAAMQKLEGEVQLKSRLAQVEAKYEMEKMKLEATLKSQLMAEEFNYNVKLNGMSESLLNARDEKKEKAKDKRIDLQASRESELINQRKNNLPPKKFESSVDNMQPEDLGEFEPR